MSTGLKPSVTKAMPRNSSSASATHAQRTGSHNRSASAPPIFRPQPASAAQAKPERALIWPPVYRPAVAVQPKLAAPPVYRPGAKQIAASTAGHGAVPQFHGAPRPVLQTKQNSSLHTPPPYRPFASFSPGSSAQPKVSAVPASRIAPQVWSRPFISTIQRAEMEVEVEEKEAAPAEDSLAALAKKIHAGDLSQSTTGIAKLKNGKLVAATQGSVEAVQKKAGEAGVELADVFSTYGAGYHCEVSLYIKYGEHIVAMGASQGFCPHCQEFLSFHGITMDGPKRSTRDQVWRSPEFRANKEKTKGAPYPWVYFRDEVEGRRLLFKTKALFDEWYKKRTGGK